MMMWRWWLLVVHLLSLTTASAVDDSTTVHGTKERSGTVPATVSRHADPDETKEIQVMIIPLDKIEEYNAITKNVADQEAKDGFLQSSVNKDQPVLMAKISPLALKSLTVPHLHLSPKLELIRQRIKLRNLLIKAKIRQRMLTPGLLRSTQTEPDVPEDSSEEFLMNVLGSNSKDFGSRNDLIKNTVLTKTTTYNITNLNNDTRDPEFLVSKKDDFTVVLSLLDKKGRPTNLSNAHSSTLQLVIDSDSEEQEPFDPVIATITLHNITNNNKKNHDLDGNKDGSGLDENSTLRNNLGILSTRTNSNEITTLGTNCDNDDLTGAECDHKAPTDFVNGQYTSFTNRLDSIVGYSNPASTQDQAFEMVSGQLIPINGEHNTTEYVNYKVGETEPIMEAGSSTSGKSILLQETLTEINLDLTDDHKDVMPIVSTSNETLLTSDENKTKEKAPGRSDISISKEETSGELNEDNYYGVVSILGESNNQTYKPSINETRSFDDDLAIISNTSIENYRDLKNKEEEPGEFRNTNNKHKAKSGNKNVFESSQLEETIPPLLNDSAIDISENDDFSSSSKIGISNHDTILGETETPGTSLEDSGTEVTKQSTDTVIDSLEDVNVNSENRDELSSENLGGDQTILMKDHNKEIYVTESKEESTDNDSTKPTSDNIVGGTVESTEVDKVGEPSSLEPSQLNSTLEKTLQEESASEENNIDDEDLGSHPVELSAGSSLVGDYSNTEGPYTDNDDNEEEYLTELCFPLKNNNLSLLDLLSGHFYIEKNGRKIPLHLQDNPMKNCTSATKKCKLYLNFKKNGNNSDNEMDLNEDNSSEIITTNKKRNVRALNALELNSNRPIIIYEIFNRSLDSLSLQPMNEKVIQRSEDEKVVPHRTHFASKEGSKDDHPIVYPQNLLLESLLPSSKPISKTDSQNYSPVITTSRPTSQLHDYTRTARHVDEDSSSSGRCTCDSTMLQSPLPKLGYAHFVQKRLAILTNIVQAVNKYAYDSKEGS